MFMHQDVGYKSMEDSLDSDSHMKFHPNNTDTGWVAGPKWWQLTVDKTAEVASARIFTMLL